MSVTRSKEHLIALIQELIKFPHETAWIEFKENNDKPEEIGEYISALSNSAALYGKNYAYLIWGIEDKSHRVNGTGFSPFKKKIGNEELENWLYRLLKPRIPFHFFEIDFQGKHVVLLEIGHAFQYPVQFQGTEYIRVGSYKKKLKDFPEKERELWHIFDQTPFEIISAVDGLSDSEVLEVLDYSAYFALLALPVPESRRSVLESLKSDQMISETDSGLWLITNLGALLFARRLSDFQSLKRKTIRVIVYKGNSRIQTEREQEVCKGYAAGFETLIEFINALLPSNEIIERALRKNVPVFP